MAEIELRAVTGLIDADPVQLREFVRSVLVDHAMGEPASLQFQLSCWDVIACDYDPIASQVFGHYESLEAWVNGECLGLFYVEEDTVAHDEEGCTRNIEAFDALRRLKRETESRVYENVASQARIVEDLAKVHGLTADAKSDEMRELDPSAYDIVKRLGDTDLQLAHRVAMAEGLGLPYIRYTPAPSRGATSLHRPGVEELVVRRMFAAGIGQQQIELAVVRPTSEEGDLISFTPTFDTGDLPEAVEVVGWDKDAGSAFRVTVVATPRGPVVESIVDRDITKKELAVVRPRRGQDADSVVFRTLGAGREQAHTGVTYRSGKRRIRAKVEYREILTEEAIANVSDGVAYATSWMAARLAGYITFQAETLPNLIGSEALKVGKVVYIYGCLPAHVGYYILERTVHRWDERGHSVQLEGRRLIEAVAVTPHPAPQLEEAA